MDFSLMKCQTDARIPCLGKIPLANSLPHATLRRGPDENDHLFFGGLVRELACRVGKGIIEREGTKRGRELLVLSGLNKNKMKWGSKLTECVIVWKKGTDFSIEIDHLLVNCDKRDYAIKIISIVFPFDSGRSGNLLRTVKKRYSLGSEQT
jgi:hypothetical protein